MVIDHWSINTILFDETITKQLRKIRDFQLTLHKRLLARVQTRSSEGLCTCRCIVILYILPFGLLHFRGLFSYSMIRLI